MDNPPAFPVPAHPNYPRSGPQPGMTLRDWFAGGIANGMAAHSGTSGLSFGPGDIARRSYEIADAMLAERSKPTESAASMQHVAYFDEGEFHWMSGIAPRDCELYAERAKDTPSHG